MKNRFWLLFFVLSIHACNKQEKYIEYHINGEIELEGQFLNGKKNGDWIEYDSLGIKKSQLKYKNDTLLYRELYIDGKLLTTEEMKGGIKHGKTTLYYKDGNGIESVMTFVDGVQKGEQLFYYQQGQLSSKYVEKGNGEVIEYHQYYPNGSLYIYAKNLVNGEFNIYDSLGNRTYDLLYENAELIDTLRSY